MNKETDENLEINIGKYIEILIRQWRLIAVCLFVSAAAAVMAIYIKPSVYQARVLVATTKIASSVTFGSQIETLSEGQLPVTLVDRKARLQSYVALVTDPVIAERVYEFLQPEFGENLPDPESLVEMVSGAVLTGTDMIEIQVSNGDPTYLLAIANTWGRHYVDFINKLYASGTFNETVLNIQRQTSDAHAKYMDAQEEYISFLTSSRVDEYTHLRDDLRRVDRLLLDALALQEQVNTGGEGAAASNALAVSILKTQVFASSSTSTMQVQSPPNPSPMQFQTIPYYLQFQASPVIASSQDLLSDINSLVIMLQNRRQALMEWTDYLVLQLDSHSISANSEAGSTQTTSSMQDTVSLSGAAEEKMRLLASRIEYEEGRKKDLALTRDVAWDAYQNLSKKEAELVVASQTGGQEVVLGSTAIIDKVGGSITLVALAALVGLVLGVFLAFFIEYWWDYKGREPQAIFEWNIGGSGGKDG
jgi:polysaccharide biosynthesis transport protein